MRQAEKSKKGFFIFRRNLDIISKTLIDLNVPIKNHKILTKLCFFKYSQYILTQSECFKYLN